MTVFGWGAVSNCDEYFAERGHNAPCLLIIVPDYLWHLRLLWLRHDNVTRGLSSGHQRTCWQWEGVTSGLIGPVIIYYPTLTVGILHKASEATAPSTPRLQGPSSVLWWEDTPETVSKVREGRWARAGGGSITSVGGERLATSGLPECKTLTKYFVLSAGRRQGQDHSHPQLRERKDRTDAFVTIFC